MALNEAGRHEEALPVFRDALAAYERKGRADDVRFAHWQIAHTLRRLGRIDEALAMQFELERQAAAAGAPDADVFEELALLFEARAEPQQAERYRALQRAAQGEEAR